MEIALYCPSCHDRVPCKALSLAFDEIVTCASCSGKAKAGNMLTGEGKTLLDYLAFLTVQASAGAERRR